MPLNIKSMRRVDTRRPLPLLIVIVAQIKSSDNGKDHEIGVGVVDDDVVIPPQTKFSGVYRSELVCRSVCRSVGPSVRINCPLSNSSSFNASFTNLGQKLYLHDFKATFKRGSRQVKN
ncbi:hypothetical protein DPMN_091632 [Dreissena polymorpha]|uniref:Uncharacterized protein n=1 Tax=Dreissena polymorpha TaxID=45954 RepID=A0A9D4L2F7_DREPO|nr:hypothetical protein DPMN_091632 [Dreissena polymorpha]